MIEETYGGRSTPIRAASAYADDDGSPGPAQEALPALPAARHVEVRVFESVGELHGRAFFQRMMNRLGFGAVRYSKGGAGARAKINDDVRPLDYAETIKWRVRQFQATGDREHLVDAANYCLLLWRTLEDAEDSPLAGGSSSPGNVDADGRVVGARGVWASLNGARAGASSAPIVLEPDSLTCLRLVSERLRRLEEMGK